MKSMYSMTPVERAVWDYEFKRKFASLPDDEILAEQESWGPVTLHDGDDADALNEARRIENAKILQAECRAACDRWERRVQHKAKMVVAIQRFNRFPPRVTNRRAPRPRRAVRVATARGAPERPRPSVRPTVLGRTS